MAYHIFFFFLLSFLFYLSFHFLFTFELVVGEFLNKHTTSFSEHTLISYNNLAVCYCHFFGKIPLFFDSQRSLSLSVPRSGHEQAQTQGKESMYGRKGKRAHTNKLETDVDQARASWKRMWIRRASSLGEGGEGARTKKKKNWKGWCAR